VTAPAELVMRSEALEVVLLPELGARLHRLRAFGHDVLRTPEHAAKHRDEPFFWGAFPMAPWCNRIAPGRTSVAGRTVDLAPTFPDGTAIHGQVHSRAWDAAPDGSLRVAGGGDEWPWRYQASLRAEVAASTLALDYRLDNRSDAAMPAGLGLHPWFRAPLEVSLPAAEAYAANSNSPTEPEPVAGRFDLRTLGAPASGLDGTWTGLAPPAIDLAWPELGLLARLEIDAPRALVALATPEGMEAIAIEPQTHGPDGLRRFLGREPDALTLLAPGDSLRLALRLSFSPAPTIP
jgi:aldose 1-epimerase